MMIINLEKKKKLLNDFNLIRCQYNIKINPISNILFNDGVIL